MAYIRYALVSLALGTAACASSKANDIDAATGGSIDGAAVEYDAAPPVDAPPDAAPPPDAPPGCVDEICDNGLDENCDGQPDDGCDCEPTTEASCYTGTPETRGVGDCADGTMTCFGDATGEVSFWGPCEGDRQPGLEVCDLDLADEDCDATANEDCECVPGSDPVPCGSDVGECVAGGQECIVGALGPCEGGTGPADEECDGLDNDCDTFTDEGLVRACGTDTGACSPGEETCAAGEWGACEGGVTAVGEVCNDADDDCDGPADEETEVSCGTDDGLCVAGTSFCVGGVYGPCMLAVDPVPEVCDTFDNDCDTRTDEGLTRACGDDTGVCTAGIETCSPATGTYGGCTAIGPDTPGPSEAPSFCDGLDSDCDGPIDDGCTCTTGAMMPCGTDVGLCEFGSQTCTGGAWGPCTGGVTSVPEVCGNGLDENCNGTPDDGCAVNQPPVVTCSGDISTFPLTTVTVSATGSDPDGGAVTYMWTVTARPPGSTSNPASPNNATTTFFVDLVGNYTLTVTVTDDEGATATCTVDITAVPFQDLLVQLTWDEAFGDADLHVLAPSGDVATDWYSIGGPTIEDDCFWNNIDAKWPPSGGQGDGHLDIDDRAGSGPENISVPNNPTDGTYKIGVAYYCDHNEVGGSGGPGPTGATVRVYCSGLEAAVYNFDLDETGRFVYVADIEWPGCAGSSVMAQQWTAEVQTAGIPNPIHCAILCDGPSDCTPGERCVSGSCALD